MSKSSNQLTNFTSTLPTPTNINFHNASAHLIHDKENITDPAQEIAVKMNNRATNLGWGLGRFAILAMETIWGFLKDVDKAFSSAMPSLPMVKATEISDSENIETSKENTKEEEAIKKDRATRKHYLELGMQYNQEKQFQFSVANFKKAYDEADESSYSSKYFAEIISNRGDIFYNKWSSEDRISIPTVRTREIYIDSLYNYGEELNKKGDVMNALETLKQAIWFDSHGNHTYKKMIGRIYGDLGNKLYEEGNITGAIEAFQNARIYDFSNTSYSGRLADIHYNSGNYLEAAQDFMMFNNKEIIMALLFITFSAPAVISIISNLENQEKLLKKRESLLKEQELLAYIMREKPEEFLKLKELITDIVNDYNSHSSYIIQDKTLNSYSISFTENKRWTIALEKAVGRDFEFSEIKKIGNILGGLTKEAVVTSLAKAALYRFAKKENPELTTQEKELCNFLKRIDVNNYKTETKKAPRLLIKVTLQDDNKTQDKASGLLINITNVDDPNKLAIPSPTVKVSCFEKVIGTEEVKERV